MLICGLDFEATGTDPQTAGVLEVGCVLWDTELKIPVKLMSELVNCGMDITPEITDITGITQPMIDKYAITTMSAMFDLNELLAQADYIMAHFGTQYDKPLYEATVDRIRHGRVEKPWIDTSVDIIFPERVTTRKLSYLAAESGFLNPFSHRAIFDVLTMFKVAEGHDWDTIIARSMEPMVYVHALVGFKDNQKAKDFQFRWNPDKKIWWKGLKAGDFEREYAKYDFNYNMLMSAPE